jgi:uncharacterized membrane protein
MGTGRVEAFSDGVIAVIVTIMVLEIKPPANGDWAAPLAFISVQASFFIFILFPALHFLPERRSEVEPI